MKTIFITAYQGFVSRNILNSDVLKILRDVDDLRIVIFVPAAKKNLIEKFYGGHKGVVEGADFDKVTFANKFWYRLAFILENTQYTKDQRGERLQEHRNLLGYLNYYWVSFLAVVLSNFYLAHKLYRLLDYKFSPKDAFKEYFERYNPTLIFSTDIFGETDPLLLREAKSRNVPVVGMVRSWDNTTTKGLLRIIPQKIIVNSPVLKEELTKLHDCMAEDISIVGLPQFDHWLVGPTLSRQEFFEKIGADQNKRLILFAPAGYNLSSTDWQLCQILKDALDDGSLPGDIQFLVRNHPQHPADLSKFEGDVRFIIEVPGSRVNQEYKNAELSPDENNHLRNSVFYSDIVMYVATTLGLDSAVFNKPQIIVSFDGWERKPYIQSVKRYNHEDCLNNLVKLGGTRVVENKGDWINWINNYLKNPKLDQEGRNRIVESQLYKLDGKAGERIASFILNELART